MRFHLTLAMFIAASQAVTLGPMLSQVSASCEPNCDPSGEDFDADTDHVMKNEIDVAEDVIMSIKPVVEEALHETGVHELLSTVAGSEGADALIEETLIPCMESTVADDLVNV